MANTLIAQAEPLRTTQAPFTFRLPPAGARDPYFGGSRTFWNDLILPNEGNGFKPLVKSIVDRKVGATRGVRFILYESALQYFKRLEQQQNRAEEPVAA